MKRLFLAAQVVVVILLGALLYLSPVAPYAATGDLRSLLVVGLALVSLLLSAVASFLTRAGARSLHAVSAIASRIGNGEIGTRVPFENDPEVGELARVLNDMALRTELHLGHLSAEMNRLDTILRGMGEGIVVADPQGMVTLVNPAFRELFNLNGEVLGKPLIEISRHPALQDSFRDVMASRQEMVVEFVVRNTREKTVLTHWVPLVEQGQLQGAVAVFHDISDTRHAETMRRDFVANVSHELRTPVTIIKGYAETLLSAGLEHDPEQTARFVRIIYSHADRLAALISDLLILSQLESGTIGLQSRPVKLAAVADRVVCLLQQKAGQRKIRIDASALSEAPSVLGDSGRLEQVFFNLLDNAIKYTPAGGSVTLVATPVDSGVRVAVQDTGIGIPARDLPRIFERFYRVDSARSRDEGGTGLGLAIVKHILQLQGGSVAVESSSQGTTFFVTLPRVPVAPEAVPCPTC